MTLTKVEYDEDLDIMQIKLKDGKYAFSEDINKNTIMDQIQTGTFLPLKFLMSQIS